MSGGKQYPWVDDEFINPTAQTVSREQQYIHDPARELPDGDEAFGIAYSIGNSLVCIGNDEVCIGTDYFDPNTEDEEWEDDMERDRR